MKKQLLNKLWLRVGMIVAIMTTALAASAAEKVYSTCLFGADYNSTSISSYTDTWTASNGGFTWTIANGNNNKNGWTYVKFGRKNVASVGSIVTSAAYSTAITKVDLTIDALTATNVNSIKLYTSSDNSTWTKAGDFSKAAGTQTVNLASPTTNLYYKIEFDCASGSANGLVTVSKVEYYYNEGGTIPPSISAADLNISYDSTEGEIEYTVNNPVTGGTLTAATTAEWLTIVDVEDLVTFECEANSGAERVATVTLTYTYGSENVTKNVTVTQGANPNGSGSQANPYTVAQARAAIDANAGVTNVYATGIVSEIVEAWSTQYNNISFNFVDATGDTEFLEAFRCASGTGVDASTVAVGDVVVVYGNLKKHTDGTYEFAAACQLVSLTKPTSTVETPIFSPEGGIYTSPQTVTLAVEAPTMEGYSFYYTTDGTDPTTNSTLYTGPIEVSTTTTIKAIAVKGGETSLVATATYAILGHAGTEADPYTVADARAAIDANAGLTDVYATGIVSAIPTAWSTEHSNITFNFVDAEGEEVFLQAYRCASGTGVDASTVAVGDVVVVKGNLTKYNTTYEFASGCQLVSLTHSSGPADPVINAENATIAYDVTYYELMYSIDNPIEGTELEASADASATWITSVTPSTKSFDRVMIECEANEGTEARTAIITLVYGEVSKEVTLTQEAYAEPVEDYVTLPYSWAGGTKEELLAETGVTADGLGNDYAEANAPYRVKFDTTGDYIQFKTNERPGVVTIGVKMLGGATTSSITVRESADGVSFTDLQTLTISGAQNDILTLKTTTPFAETTRFVCLYFTRGSNVGVGPISIAQYGEIVIKNYLLTIANPENVTITANYGGEAPLTNGNEAEVAEGTNVTVTVSPAEGYDFESLTIEGEEEGQTVTPSPGTTEGAYTFTMPAYNVTINATVVEHVEPVLANYVLTVDITPGKRYVIASGKEDGTVYVMGEQKTNNRGVVATEVENGLLSVSEEYEFVIEEANVEGGASGYSIFDPDAEGYLYAASSGSNYLKTQTELNENGIWAIEFEAGSVASIVAQGANERNVMQFNPNTSNNNPLFSCYGSASQSPVYLYEKIEEVPLVETVTVTSVGYATLVAETHLDIPADLPVEVYAVQVNGNSATLIPVTDGIPYRAAVLIKAEAGDYDFPYHVGSISSLEVNDLKGSFTDVVADGTQYVLANGANGVGFYQATPGSTIAAGKAYLEVSSGVKSFYGFDDDATSIKDLNDLKDSKDVIYNLAGQRIQKMQRGINIVGGKKVLR